MAAGNAAELGEQSVLSLAGDAVPLRSFWSEGPAVLVFLRHYG